MRSVILSLAVMVVVTLLAGCGNGNVETSAAGPSNQQVLNTTSAPGTTCTVGFNLTSDLPVAPQGVKAVSFNFVLPAGIEPVIDPNGYSNNNLVQIAPSSIMLGAGRAQGMAVGSFDPATRKVEVAMVTDGAFSLAGTPLVNIVFNVVPTDANSQPLPPSDSTIEEVLDVNNTPFQANDFKITATLSVN